MPTPTITLTPRQSAVIELPADRSIFLEGPAGTGKTTAAAERLARLLRSGAPGDQTLVILPQRTLTGPYNAILRRPTVPAGGEVTVLTMGGLAQRMVELFWPLIAGPAGFAQPDRPPVFLTLETAQYFMARIAGPLLEQGYFETIVIDRNRLYSQILDNLNKAAAVGFPHAEIGSRLKAAWRGEASQLRVYDEAQICAGSFREYCLAHNLLDFSLQYELFAQHLWPLPACRNYLLSRYRHLLADNSEEDTPVSHDILLDWLPFCRSALIVYDTGAGYRRFLGADPASAYRLKAVCPDQFAFTESHTMSAGVAALGGALRRALGPKPTVPTTPPALGGVPAQDLAFDASPHTAGAAPRNHPDGPPHDALDFTAHRYHPEMLDWVADRVAALVKDEGTPPRQIAILAPFVGGGLRFSLENRLAAYGIPVRSHRPSRALNEEPVTACLMTLLALCHPAWRLAPTKYDVAYALMQAIADMDLVRGQLLAEIAYRVRDGAPTLAPFAGIEPEMQERITFVLGGRYEGLRSWLSANTRGAQAAAAPPARPRTGKRAAARREDAALDHFLSRLFGELLSQPGYGFHGDFTAGEVTAKVIESARKFRQVMDLPPQPPSLRGRGEVSPSPGRGGVGGEVAARGGVGGEVAAAGEIDLARDYVQLVRDGVVAAQYVRSWQRQPENAVLLAPAYTFLMSNQPVDHQFWLDVGGTGWWERLYQPLTQPYVLSRRWPAGAIWGDLDEYAARQEALSALALGLLRRCRVRIHLGLAEMSEAGNEQRGPLLRAIQNVLRAAQTTG